MKYFFPFGSHLIKVEQQDKSPKKVFVLGVYASAVHAKWIDTNGKVIINALAVASEPEIFWKGGNAHKIIDEISIPSELGKLKPADKRFNGPSGKVLDDLFLSPLGYSRADAWLCDLLPYSRLNPNQKEAIKNHYKPLLGKYDLPECSIPTLTASDMNSNSRKDEILKELEQSQADTIILLGDLPIKHFLSRYSNYNNLSDLVEQQKQYGDPCPISINGKIFNVIPLVHPRQAGSLGNSSQKWFEVHKNWVVKKMNEKKEHRNIRISQKPNYCLVCGSENIASYLYGMPVFSKKLENDIDEGKVILGGCCITDFDLSWACMNCKTDFIHTDSILGHEE